MVAYSFHRGTSIKAEGGLAMRDRAKEARKARGVTFAECCGQVCDERCREGSVRARQFDRRLSTPGGTRVS
jgi:hypothetical protein